MFDWDDLKVFAAVARAGTTLAAARRLGVSQPTVVRRIAGLEQATGVALFERGRTGYRLTDAGQEILPLAEQVAREMAAIADVMASRSRRLTGTIRVTAAEPVANLLLAPAVLAFQRTHPDVEIQLLLSDRFLDLTRGEADVALRATINGLEDSDLIGRRLADAPWAVYCSRGYADTKGRPSSLPECEGHAILSSERSTGGFPAMLWLEEAAPNAKVVWRSNSLASLQSAVRAGLGLSSLPCLLGRNDPELVKCFDAGGANCPDIWILSHAGARRQPHVRSFIEALGEHVIAHADQLRDESR
ncbi:LysR family transcriptional regulator [Brevundimonas sp.]|uniref:LysR family transcriptional regulator n=1 Tax=Brevundimonas sp. TaxID=1871086 RepID=UPI002D4B4132|nr:LysR family transcriptional regulator [Brevundimonas sp.]HYC75808.1 LysR family transcriptional regulator [Brevundimonas sp.]